MSYKRSDTSIRVLLLIGAFLAVYTSFAQQVVSAIDRDEIKIGEQITYSIQASLDTTSQVAFPKPELFPMEVVKLPKADTIAIDGQWKILQKYQLTQFDSGRVNLPKFKVFIDSLSFDTQSYEVLINDVEVDTTQQKMYDIKPIIKVEKSVQLPWNWILIVLVIGLISYGLYRYYKKGIEKFEKEEEALIPPFDKAMSELDRLENSSYLIKEEFKEYYSQLTNIVRSYLEEEVHISALESTTQQLIDQLELLKDSGALELDQETIDRFDEILKTADLVKFARSKPEISRAEQDRKHLKEVVTKTKEAIPEPTEEELLQQEAYKQALLEAEKRRKKRQITWAIAALGVLLLGGGIFYVGPKNIWDTVTFNSSRRLLTAQWVTSDYGIPPIQLSTPKVLVRNLTSVAATNETNRQQFELQDQEFSMYLTTVQLNTEDEPDFDQLAEASIASLEALGGKNIITRQEPHTTVDGVEGVKVFGRFSLEDQSTEEKRTYELYVFGGKGFAQQVLLIYTENEYTKQIKEAIVASVRLKELANDE